MKTNTPFRAEKPVSVWNKPLSLNFKEFFKGLTGAITNIATGNASSLPKDLADIAGSVGLKITPEERTWLLVYRSITSAIYELVNESIDMFVNTPEDTDALCERIVASLDNQPVVLDKNLFLHPGDLPFLIIIGSAFQEWLLGWGLQESQVAGICSRLRSYFIYALNTEWRRRPSDYASIVDIIQTPFTQAEERERSWNQYYSWLQKQTDASMFGEAFSLNQVYVPLRAYYEEKSKKNDKKASVHETEKEQNLEDQPICHVVDLQTELDKWLKCRDKSDAIRVISGGPGCGKSSFAKVYAAHVAQNGDTRVLFIPLHQFDPKDDLTQAVGDFVITADHFSYNPLDPVDGEKRLLIIFDGLDELSKQGRIGAEIAQQFVREIEKKVELRNEKEIHLQVLLSGRALFIQANASEFRKREEILHILPFVESKNFAARISDPKGLLQIDQRDLWWQKYGLASGMNFNAMPEQFKTDELQDITAEPLLNYLFAIIYAKDNLESTTDINLNDIYEKLLNSVYQRGYGENRLRKSIPEMSEQDFLTVLEEIGLAAWHGGGRTTTVDEIMSCCAASGTSNLLEKFEEGAKKGVTRLLAAFYFRESGDIRGTERAIEFTHKSFGEYLTVRRIIRLLKLIHSEHRRYTETPGAGWSFDYALLQWAWLFGPSPMDEYLFDFLCREVLKFNIDDTLAAWQQILVEMIEYMLSNGMPMEKLEGRLSYAEQRKQARNAEEALLACLNACARCTQQISTINWPDTISAGGWIKSLQGQRITAENCLAMQCLNYISFKACTLYMSDFYHANMCHCDLRHSRATFSIFRGAGLIGSDLGHANFFYSNLEDVDLHGANLENASLQCTNLLAANLRNANLRNANLQGANLENADLQDANLEGVKLSKKQLAQTKGTPRSLPKSITLSDNDKAHNKTPASKKVQKIGD